MTNDTSNVISLESAKQAKVVTIDGPSASGKTSVSRALARQLGWSWVSTGAFYRGLAWVATREGLDLTNEAALAKVLEQPQLWRVEMGEEQTEVIWNDVPVTDYLHGERVGAWASQISQHKEVRDALLPLQRQCAESSSRGLIAEGRDCGSVVFPSALLKVYLDANQEERLLRRQSERSEQSGGCQVQRDYQDSHRNLAPMKAAPGAIVLNTSGLSIEEVTQQVRQLVDQTWPQKSS